MGFKEEMEAHDEQFETDKASAGRLPDGRYNNAVITEARIEHDEEDDRYSWMLKYEADYNVTTSSGDALAHSSVRNWYNLDHEVGRSIAAQDAKKFGYEGKLSDLEEACENEFFIGFVCDIKVETKPGTEREFTNVYLNRVLGKGEAGDFAGAATTSGDQLGADDDIPF